MEEVVRRIETQVASDFAPVNGLCLHVGRYHGKMLRPVLVLLSAMAADPSIVRPTDAHPYPPDIEDVTIRTNSARVLESEDFTDKLYEKIEKYCIAIDKVVTRILNEE